MSEQKRFIFPLKVMQWSTLQTENGQKLKPGGTARNAGRSWGGVSMTQKRKVDGAVSETVPIYNVALIDSVPLDVELVETPDANAASE